MLHCNLTFSIDIWSNCVPPLFHLFQKCALKLSPSFLRVSIYFVFAHISHSAHMLKLKFCRPLRTLAIFNTCLCYFSSLYDDCRKRNEKKLFKIDRGMLLQAPTLRYTVALVFWGRLSTCFKHTQNIFKSLNTST